MGKYKIKYYDLSVDGFVSTLFVVMDSAGEIIGSCMFFHDGLIQDFHIVEKFRGTGIGSGLLTIVEEIAKKKGIKLIYGFVKDGNKAKRFWLMHSFSAKPNGREWKISKEILSLYASF